MDKKSKIRLTNEKIIGKFDSSFELVNYAIKLAENMIKTGRDARVKSDVQNRAMLILEEIQEGKDQFDEIEITKVEFEGQLDNRVPHKAVDEERLEKRKYRHSEPLEVES